MAAEGAADCAKDLATRARDPVEVDDTLLRPLVSAAPLRFLFIRSAVKKAALLISQLLTTAFAV